MKKYKIVSVSGRIGSGKDTIADYLVNEHDFKRLSFASSLKDATAAVFNWNRELLEGTTKESRLWREQVDVWWSERLSIPNLTPRYILQNWGTELFRNNFHQDIWVASLENKLLNSDSNIVITDARFDNEISIIKKLNGIAIRVERGQYPDWYEDARIYNTSSIVERTSQSKRNLEKANIHASEYGSVGLDYDHVIENNGTILDLQQKIRSIIDG